MTPEELLNKYRNVRSDISALAKLEEIDWSSVQHAHGEASDFPILMNAALSADKDDREFALKLLHETIWHQGTIYQATAFAVPFIVKLIQSPDISNQADFAMLFAAIAQGSGGPFEYGFEDKKDEEMWQEIYAKQGQDLFEEMKEYKKWCEATRDEVAKNLHVIYPFLSHSDKYVRPYIAEALSCYPELSFQTMPLIEESIRSEKDEDTKGWLEQALHKLKENSER